ncbi:MAG: hypothetical protein JG782_1110, partial [Anaerophaga sp.]|nr:hypothetical protein [Anaerophaga sp.]
MFSSVYNLFIKVGCNPHARTYTYSYCGEPIYAHFILNLISKN